MLRVKEGYQHQFKRAHTIMKLIGYARLWKEMRGEHNSVKQNISLKNNHNSLVLQALDSSFLI